MLSPATPQSTCAKTEHPCCSLAPGFRLAGITSSPVIPVAWHPLGAVMATRCLELTAPAAIGSARPTDPDFFGLSCCRYAIEQINAAK